MPSNKKFNLHFLMSYCYEKTKRVNGFGVLSASHKKKFDTLIFMQIFPSTKARNCKIK